MERDGPDRHGGREGGGERRDAGNRREGGGRGGRNRRRRRRFRRSGPALPPPEHGIRVTQIGGTWWGERWVTALMRFGTNYVARLARGTTYAHQGRVHDLAVKRHGVTAFVTGSRPEPYRVTLALRPLPADTWGQAIATMASKARFAAQLLAGEMPREIDEAFAAARTSLFPLRRADMRTKCSCPDSANPCKHIAALHLVLAQAFDRDPFLLFELRGRSKEAVLGALRDLRSGAATAPPTALPPAATATPPAREAGATEPPGQRPAATPSVATRGSGRPAAPAAYDEFRQPVDDLHFHITAPAAEGAFLRQLGPPPAWALDKNFADLVQAAVSRAARLARQVALEAKPEAREPATDGDPGAPKGDRVPRPRAARPRKRAGTADTDPRGTATPD
jgi:uncharacterized Zn finger protein